MKQTATKIFFSILLLLAAAALIFYGINGELGVYGIPLHKLLLGIMLLAWIFAKILFGSSLRERFKIFLPLGLLFMLLEAEIAKWVCLADANIINNWLVLLAALLADTAMIILLPGKKRAKTHFFSSNIRTEGAKESRDKNCFGESVIYIDASTTTQSFVMNKLGETNVYYQNADKAPEGVIYELNVENLMGETTVHVPCNWVVINEMTCTLGEINTRENPEGETKLIIRGHNKMGETSII